LLSLHKNTAGAVEQTDTIIIIQIMPKPQILITNDDGISAPGIRYLIGIMKQLGDVAVVAPDKPQSAMGHAITVGAPLRLQKIVREPGYTEYSCNGTPVDCVKIGIDKVIHRRPDLLVSGINHGSNSSINIIYSGTMSAALEGAMLGIPSIGFSLHDYSHSADFSLTGPFIKEICKNVLKNGIADGTALNVNFPPKKGTPKGIKICRQARAYWQEEFDERKDPFGRPYYWLKGVFTNHDLEKDTDEWALAHNYVSVVPVHFDFTAMHAIESLKKWKFNV